VLTSGWHPDNVEEADRELLARQVWGEPDEDRWLTVQVAELHGYLFDLSEPDLADQADELSALIPAILAQLYQHGDTVLALETADWLASFDSVALLGATVNRLERAASLLGERLAYALADHLPLVKGRPSRTAGARTSPGTGGWPAAGTLSITASWSEPATHQQPAPRSVGTPIAAHRSPVGAATEPCLVRNTTRRSPTSGQAAGSIAHDVHAITARGDRSGAHPARARRRNTRGYRSYSARVGVGQSQSHPGGPRRRLVPSRSETN
jgi:hypothetical protein